jgi:hypothetical protein
MSKVTIIASALCFGTALAHAKEGHMIAREGWNGKNMFVYIVPAASYPAQTGVAKAYFGEEAYVPYRAYLALKTADGDVATWAPSGSDVLAEDWLVLGIEAEQAQEECAQQQSMSAAAGTGFDPHWQEVNTRMECLRTAVGLIASGQGRKGDPLELAKEFYSFANGK